jgi:hypothetical protein
MATDSANDSATHGANDSATRGANNGANNSANDGATETALRGRAAFPDAGFRNAVQEDKPRAMTKETRAENKRMDDYVYLKWARIAIRR